MNAELWWALGAAGFMVALIAAMTIASFLRTARLKRAIARERREWELRSAQRRHTALRSRMQTEGGARAPAVPALTATQAADRVEEPDGAEDSASALASPTLALDPMAGLAPLHLDETLPAETATVPPEPEPADSADEQRPTADDLRRLIERLESHDETNR
ncbi:MAG: hypothetical protein SNJ59_06805 [Aggregatilineales bacterium]